MEEEKDVMMEIMYLTMDVVLIVRSKQALIVLEMILMFALRIAEMDL